MKKLLFVVVLLFVISGLKAQNITIKGSVFDKTHQESIPSASIRLLSPRDSSYITGTVTLNDGSFNLTVPAKQYIVEVSFMGLTNKYINVTGHQNNVNLGKIFLSENSIMLNVAVVTAKAVDIMVKGDTVEYNADSYKVQESAVLEDLVKKIPGAEVDADGKITVNGKEISKILVDGKEFFSDDPKVASKNLPAKMIEKLQVLDRRSDMAQLTGFDDGEEETVMNLTIKPGMKEGLFGNFLGGYGSRDRYEGNGIVNYMRNNTQFTVLGGLNNTNNAGFTDFASNMGSGGPPRGVTFGGSNGVAKTNNLGVNFATEIKDKLKVNGDVRYGKVDNDVRSEKDKNYGLNQMKEREYMNSWGNNKSENFGANFRIEWTPDTLTKIIFRPTMEYKKNENYQISDGYTEYADGASGLALTEDTTFYKSKSDGWNANGDLMMSRKLSNNGRSITLRFAGGYSDDNSDAFNYSNNIYKFKNAARPDSIPNPIDQLSKEDKTSYNWRASIAYVEPLGRNNFLEMEYTARNDNSDSDKKVFSNDNLDNYGLPVDSVTRRIENDFVRHNVTLSFQSMRQKFNYTIGLGLEPTKTSTEITDPILGKRKGKAINTAFFAPRARFNYIWSKRKTLRMDYWGSASQPSTRQLFDGIYSNSGNKIERGNTRLKPSYQNRVSIRYQNFNPEKASTFMVFARFSYTTNDIVSTTRWEGTKSAPLEVNSYDNINGNMNGNARIIFNTPINKNRNLSVNSMSFLSFNRKNSFVSKEIFTDPVKNRADEYRFTESAGIRFTSQFFDFTTRGNFTYKQVDNNVVNNNQKVYDFGGYADFTLHLPFNFHIDSDLTYSGNSGYTSGFERKEWLWNASIAKDFLKAKNATIRIKMYDILKERSNISWSSSDNYTQSIRTNTINSYLMVNFVYRFQMFKGGASMPQTPERGPRRGPGDGPGGGFGRGGERHF